MIEAEIDYLRRQMKKFPDTIREAKADAWDECEAAKYVVMLKADGSGLARVKNNPYRSQA